MPLPEEQNLAEQPGGLKAERKGLGGRSEDAGHNVVVALVAGEDKGEGPGETDCLGRTGVVSTRRGWSYPR